MCLAVIINPFSCSIHLHDISKQHFKSIFYDLVKKTSTIADMQGLSPQMINTKSNYIDIAYSAIRKDKCQI